MSRINILGIEIDDLKSEEAAETAISLSEKRNAEYIVTPNSEMILNSSRDPALKSAINSAAMAVPDSAGVMLSAKILGTPFGEKIPGYDLSLLILKKLSEKGGSVFLLGGKPGVGKAAAENILNKYPGINICGEEHGYFDNESEIVRKINCTEPDFIMVCLGSPRQELWMAEHSGRLNAGVMMGLGGTIDVLAGTAKLAPQVWRDSGFEWLYRLLHDPKRITRMAKLPLIIFKSAAVRIKEELNGQR